MAAGDFTATQLNDVQELMYNLFTGERLDVNLNKPVPTAINALSRQTATIHPVLVSGECRAVEVGFLQDTITTSGTPPSSNCEITGTQGESAKITLNETHFRQVEFAVYDDQCKDGITFEQKLSYMMARAFVELELWLNNSVITFFDANAMNATYLTIDTEDGTLVGDEIQVALANLNTAEYLASMQYIANKHDVFAAWILSGKNLWVPKFASQFKSPSCCTVDALYDGPFDIAFDIKNLDTTVGSRSTFLIDPNGYVIWPKNDYMNDAPEGKDDQYNTFVWRQRSERLQYASGGTLSPVYFDVKRQRKCVIDANNHERWADHFRVQFRGGMSLGPDPSAVGSGIIQFVAV